MTALGVTAPARSAGPRIAKNADASTPAATTPYTRQSVAVTPNRTARIARETRVATIPPIPIPAAPSRMASPSIKRRIELGDPPNASRIPNSRRRVSTSCMQIAYSATTVSASAAAANTPHKIIGNRRLNTAFDSLSCWSSVVTAYAVTQRTRELGIRMALGARGVDVVGLLMRESLRRVAVGVGLGLLAALGVTRALSAMLFEVAPRDSVTFAGTALLLIAVALVATWVPARRATKVDPMVALRYE